MLNNSYRVIVNSFARRYIRRALPVQSAAKRFNYHSNAISTVQMRNSVITEAGDGISDVKCGEPQKSSGELPAYQAYITSCDRFTEHRWQQRC